MSDRDLNTSLIIPTVIILVSLYQQLLFLYNIRLDIWDF